MTMSPKRSSASGTAWIVKAFAVEMRFLVPGPLLMPQRCRHEPARLQGGGVRLVTVDLDVPALAGLNGFVATVQELLQSLQLPSI